MVIRLTLPLDLELDANLNNTVTIPLNISQQWKFDTVNGNGSFKRGDDVTAFRPLILTIKENIITD